jgi:hypothetical protein
MKEEFDNELREHSPLLSDLKKRKTGEAFKVPKYYFENLTDKILAEAKTMEKTVLGTAKQTPHAFRLTSQYPTVFARLQSYWGLVFQPKYGFALASLALVMTASWYVFKPKSIDNQAVVVQVTPNESPQATETPLANMPPTAKINESPKSTVVPNDKLVLNDVPKADIESYIKDNLGEFDDNSVAEKTPKLADARIKKENTDLSSGTHEGFNRTHPQSGLTEEELELYLKDTLEEGILDDGSDNKL